MPKICNSCKSANPNDAHFCAECGKSLSATRREYVVVEKYEYEDCKKLYKSVYPSDPDVEVLAMLTIILLEKWNALNRRFMSTNKGASIEFVLFVVFSGLAFVAALVWFVCDIQLWSTIALVASIGVPILMIMFINETLS